MTMLRYVTKRYLLAFLKVLVVAVLLILLSQFVENIRKYGGDGGSVGEIFVLTLLQLPAAINRLLPLVMMVSSLTMFLGLARSSELVITRAAGVSGLRMAFVPVVVAVLFGIGVTTVFNPIIAATSKRFDLMEDRLTNSKRSVLSVSQDGLWLRQVVEETQTVIHARRASPDGSTLSSAEFHVFDSDGLLSERVVAATAVLKEGVWDLTNVRRWKVNISADEAVGAIIKSDGLSIPTDLTIEQILDSFARPNTISFWELRGFIEHMEDSGFSATRHRQHFQTALATPVVFAAMVLIGAGFAMRHVRFGSTGVMVLSTVLAGFALYSFNNIAASLGAAGSVPVVLAAWAPGLGAIMLVLGLLLHLEDG